MKRKMYKIYAQIWRDGDLWYAKIRVDRTSWVIEKGVASRRSIYRTIHRFTEAMGVTVNELSVDDVNE